MTPSLTVYFGIWGTLVLAHLGLLYEYQTKWQILLANLGDGIVSYNVRNGYGRQISGLQLAKAFVIPWKKEGLGDFAVANGVSIESYEDELNENIGKPVLLMVGITVHILATLYTTSGLTYLIPSGFIPPSTFLILGGSFFVISMALFSLSILHSPDYNS